MAVKLTVAEWNKYYNDPEVWPSGCYHEDAELTLEGNPLDDWDDLTNADQGAKVTLNGGVVYLDENMTDSMSMEAHLKRWRKKQATAVVVCEVAKERLEALLEAVKLSGGTVR